LSKTFFYKYRAINNYNDLSKDYSLDALFESYAIFSGRKNFNDLFDSKINIEYPTSEQLLSLLRQPTIDIQGRRLIESIVLNGTITATGIKLLERFKGELNELIDAYPIYSVSSLCTCNLLWSHYASSHKGFCIEFNFDENEQPHKVTYQKDIASVSLLDIFMYNMRITTSKKFGIDIWDALHVKLEEWQYESEYRWVADNSMGKVPKGEKFIKIKYEPRKVKSIIFGCRMMPYVKNFIINHLPFTTVLKQAIETKNSIEVIDFNLKKHLS
jgi:hypothetical protein